MADIQLHSGSTSSVTCVSNYFIDHFLRELSGDSVKVYLALLRCLGDRELSFSCSGMASQVGFSAREVRTSLDELASAGLISLDYDSEGELCDICVKDCRPAAAEESVYVREETTIGETEASSDEIFEPLSQEAEEQPETEQAEESYSDGAELPEMKQHIGADRSDPDLKTILFIAQKYLGHTLTNKDLQLITYWYYDLHMSVDVIDYLITSSIEKGKTSISYMHQIAIAWYRKGIHTKDEASGEQKQFSSEANTVRKAFGLSGHAMAPAELAFLDKWFHEWDFPAELVEEACNRTIINTGKANYAYANSIIEDWHTKGISTMEQVTADDDEHRQENEKRYSQGKPAATKNKSSFAFSESNGYDDEAIAAAMYKRSTF